MPLPERGAAASDHAIDRMTSVATMGAEAIDPFHHVREGEHPGEGDATRSRTEEGVPLEDRGALRSQSRRGQPGRDVTAKGQDPISHRGVERRR